MISMQEFLVRARVDHRSLEAWIASGWLIPPQWAEPAVTASVSGCIAIALWHAKRLARNLRLAQASPGRG